MPYDQYTVDRIEQLIKESGQPYFTKRMMGGLIFMVNDKMACGTHFDKKKEVDLLMARIGEEAAEANMSRSGCHPMNFTGRIMKGFVFISPEGYDTDEDLAHWIYTVPKVSAAEYTWEMALSTWSLVSSFSGCIKADHNILSEKQYFTSRAE